MAVLAAAFLSSGCDRNGADMISEQSAGPVAERDLVVFDEQLNLEDGRQLVIQRGVITVPTNRSTVADSTIGVEFFRILRNAAAPEGAPPIFLLRGGPGFPGLQPLLDRPGYFENLLEPYTEVSDLIVVGQRGFGTSHATPCEAGSELSVVEAMDHTVRSAAIIAAARACREKWEGRGLDLTGFNVNEMAADVAELSKALGYSQVQLVGVSFGSHWGMTIIRRYPSLIARATFGGLEGPDHTYDMPAGVKGALERIAASAESSEELRSSIPEKGLLAAYQDLIDRVAADPIEVRTTHPATEEAVTVTLDADAFRTLTGGYSRGTSFRYLMAAWPLDLLTLLAGDYEAGARRILSVRADLELNDAAFYQIDCASGISKQRGERLRNDPAAALVGPLWEFYDTACTPWNADLGEAFRADFTTRVPTVLVHGNWDTSTPYENAIELLPSFRNHRFVHVEGGSHGALREAQEDVDGFREALTKWWSTGDFSHLPERVELPPMRWQSF